MSVPANITPQTAAVIAALPFTATLNVTDAPENPPGFFYAVWYKWTCPVGVTFAYLTGIKGAGSDASYAPYTIVYVGTEDVLTILESSEGTQYENTLDDEGAYYFRIPVTEGTTYWFQFAAIEEGTGAQVLEVQMLLPPTTSAPIGSFVVSDDADGFPAAVFAPDGTFLQFPPFPAGEFTATMPNGLICTQDGNAALGVAILDATWTRIATQTFGGELVAGIFSDNTAYFYVLTIPSGSPVTYQPTIYTLDRTTGAIVNTLLLTTGLSNVPKNGAPSPDGTRFYVGRGSATGTVSVDVWNLATNTLVATWAVVVGSGFQFFSTSLPGWTISDGSIFIVGATTGNTTMVAKISPVNGAVQQTYPSAIGNVGKMTRCCPISDTQFGVWGLNTSKNNQPSYFQAITISDGSVASETGPLYITNNSVESGWADEPDSISNSCPVFVLAQALSACDPATITSQPGSVSVNPGETATLSVTATGTEPIAYQWYQGASGDTSNLIPGATSASYTTPALFTPTSYWVQVTNACGSDDSDTAAIGIAAAAGADVTLIYDTAAKRFLFDQSDKTGIWTRLEEPGAGVYNQMVAGGDGTLYQYDLDAIQDDDTDLAWEVWTPWPDAGAPRLQKQWGDLGVGVDPAGSFVGITVTPVAQDGTFSAPPVVLGTGATGRGSYVVDLTSGDGIIARNFGVQITGVLGAHDTDRPALYWWEPSFVPKAPSIARRATDWDDLGYQGAKFVQGVILRANTFGLDKTVTVESDGGTQQITLTLNHDGEEQKAYPLTAAGWTPFITELIRLVGADDVDWLFLGARFVWEPAPELATQWETQFTSTDADGYLSLRDLVIAHESTAPLTLLLTYDATSQSYTIPSSGGVYKRDYVVFAPGKGKAVRFKITSLAPGRLYKRDLAVRAQSWGAAGGYRTIQPFGGTSRADGAAI